MGRHILWLIPTIKFKRDTAFPLCVRCTVTTTALET